MTDKSENFLASMNAFLKKMVEFVWHLMTYVDDTKTQHVLDPLLPMVWMPGSWRVLLEPGQILYIESLYGWSITESVNVT